MSTESLEVDVFIISKLKNDPQLIAAMSLDGAPIKIHTTMAPEGQTEGMWIVFQELDAVDTNSVGGIHNLQRLEYIIKVCVRDKGYQILRPAIKRIFELMTSGPTIVNGYHIGKFVRRGTVKDVDDFKDLRIYWFGQKFTSMVNERRI